MHNTGLACGTPPGGIHNVCDDDSTDTPLPADKSIHLDKTATLHSDVVAPNDRADAGDQIEYGFKITNDGNVTLTSVDLKDALAGLGLDPAVTCGGKTTLLPGESTTCTATYTITQADIDAGTVHNTGARVR